jgi:hypothetical protein
MVSHVTFPSESGKSVFAIEEKSSALSYSAREHAAHSPYVTFASVVPSSPMHIEEHRAKIALHHLLQWLDLAILKALFTPLHLGIEKGPLGSLSSQSSLWCQARKADMKGSRGRGKCQASTRKMVSAVNRKDRFTLCRRSCKSAPAGGSRNSSCRCCRCCRCGRLRAYVAEENVLNQVLWLAHTADLAAHAHRRHLHPPNLVTLHQSTDRQTDRQTERERQRQ